MEVVPVIPTDSSVVGVPLSHEALVPVADPNHVLSRSERKSQRDKELREAKYQRHAAKLQLFLDQQKCCGKDCYKKLIEMREDADRHLRELVEMDRASRDSIVYTLLRNGIPDKSMKVEGRQRVRATYKMSPFGSLCRAAWCHVTGVSHHKVERMLAHMRKNDFTMLPPVYRPKDWSGGAKKNVELRQRIREYVNEMVLQDRMQDPDQANHRMVLPASYSIRSMWMGYLSQPAAINCARNTFGHAFKEIFPNIILQKPRPTHHPGPHPMADGTLAIPHRGVAHDLQRQ